MKSKRFSSEGDDVGYLLWLLGKWKDGWGAVVTVCCTDTLALHHVERKQHEHARARAQTHTPTINGLFVLC